QVSRKGSGPSEYKNVNPIMALSRDTSVMVDAPNGRMLLIDATGKAVGTSPVASANLFLVNSALCAEGAGRLYTVTWIRPTDGRRITDSSYILAYDDASSIGRSDPGDGI